MCVSLCVCVLCKYLCDRESVCMSLCTYMWEEGGRGGGGKKVAGEVERKQILEGLFDTETCWISYVLNSE